MNTYTVTYYPPVSNGVTTEVPPVVITNVSAADVQLDNHALTLVDTNRNMVLVVPWYLNPVVQLTATG